MKNRYFLMMFLAGCGAPTADDAELPAPAGEKADRVTIDDPFDARSCTGKPTDLGKLRGMVLGHYQMATRTRSCAVQDGQCADWDGPIANANWDGLSGQLVVDDNGLSLVPDRASIFGWKCLYPSYSTDKPYLLGMHCPAGGGACGKYYGSSGWQTLYDRGWPIGMECMAVSLDATPDQVRTHQNALWFTATIGKRCARIVGDGALDHSYPTTEGQAAFVVRF